MMIFYLFIFCHVARGILDPQPGMETSPLALEVWSLNHWTTREVLAPLLLNACTFLKVSNTTVSEPWASPMPVTIVHPST